MSKPDGGAAFPNITPDMMVDGGPGMTLRDYFAGQMLQAISGSVDAARAAGRTPDAVAEVCYSMADHMLQERDR